MRDNVKPGQVMVRRTSRDDDVSAPLYITRTNVEIFKVRNNVDLMFPFVLHVQLLHTQVVLEYVCLRDVKLKFYLGEGKKKKFVDDVLLKLVSTTS